MEYKLEQVLIANRLIDRIESDGTYWYPLSSFFMRILCKREVTREYRDSNLKRYMRVFEYKPSYAPNKVKAWCMNERGIKFVLKRITIGNGRNKSLDKIRTKKLVEACIFFGVDRSIDLDATFINTQPNLDNYDVWSIICIKNDPSIRADTTWKKCDRCGYYFPNNQYYFVSSPKKGETLNYCRECKGGQFRCKNKTIQYIYKHNGYDLIYAMYNNKPNDIIVGELEKFIGQGGYIRNDDKCS